MNLVIKYTVDIIIGISINLISAFIIWAIVQIRFKFKKEHVVINKEGEEFHLSFTKLSQIFNVSQRTILRKIHELNIGRIKTTPKSDIFIKYVKVYTENDLKLLANSLNKKFDIEMFK